MINPLGYVLVLGAGVGQHPLIKEIRKYGGRSIAVDMNPNAPGVKEADYFLEVSIKNPQEIIQKVEALPFKKELTHCITVGTDMTSSMAKINAHFNLSGLSVQQSEVTSHKGKMREFLKASACVQPKFKYSSHKSDIDNWINAQQDQHQFVIKPVDNMGARGVIYFKDPMDTSFAFELAQRESVSKEVIVEDYIEGDEISVDALVYEGECFLTGVADRIIQRVDDMYFIETGHSMPTAQSQDVVQKIKITMQRIADALSSKVSPYHGALKADLKYTDKNEIIVGEVASRLSGGFMSTHTFPYSTGVNLMKLYLDLITKNNTAFFSVVRDIYHTSVCIERSIFTKPGKLKTKDVPQKKKFVNKDAHLCDLFVNYKEEDIIWPIKNNVGKYAHAIITSKYIEIAENFWEEIKNTISPLINYPSFEVRAMRRQAVKKFNPKYCWVCKICDGLNCASSVPGMGGINHMQTFHENNKALQQIKILPNYLEEDNKTEFEEISIKTDVLGISTKAPILTAPITGSITNMGGSISEWEYAYETAIAAKELGLIPTFGDGASSDKYWIGLKVIHKLMLGLPVFKPRENLLELEKRINKAELVGAKAWGMDVDGVWFKTMQAKAQRTKRKTYQELLRLKKCSRLPFFLKGIMSVSDAQIACEAGVSGIIVSNHGGRVLDGVPASVQVLPSITNFIKKNYPDVDILVDGGIRSGSDVFKMIALGAKAVLIGRPIVISAVAYGRFGVYDLLKKYIDELQNILKIMGLSSLKDIHEGHVVRGFNE